MAQTEILLVGESWISAATHYNGFHQFGSITYMPVHEVAESFPSTLDVLRRDGAIILSDIGANTLLLGTNEVQARPDADILARLPDDLVRWSGDATLWRNALSWVAGMA